MIMQVTDADIFREMGTDTITMQFADVDGAQDIRRVFRAMNINLDISGRKVFVPIKYLKAVRAYLHGRINPNLYRKNMPKDYYGYTGSIYYKQ